MSKPRLTALLPSRGTTICLRPGLVFRAGGTPFKLTRLESTGVYVRNETTGEVRRTDEGHLIDAIQRGELTLEGETKQPLTERQIDTLQARGVTALAIAVGQEKLQWLSELHQMGVDCVVDKPWVRAVMGRLADTTMKHVTRYEVSTLVEAQRKLRKAGGELTAVVPNYADRGGRGRLRVGERSVQMMSLEIERVRDDGTGPILPKNIYNNIKTAIDSHNASAPFDPIRMPSESTVRRQIEALIPAELRLRRAKGVTAAKKAFRNNAYPRDKALWPLEVGEYDDIDTGVFLVDERTGLPWGRAYITSGVSQSTGLILGYSLGDQPRSFESAMEAICDSLRPKQDCLPGELGYGVQGQILLDNARYNESRATMKQMEAAGLLLSLARPYGPTEKSSIEHLNAVIKRDFCQSLPGWAGAKENREGLKEGMAGAVLSLADFKQMFRHWATKIYPNIAGDDGKTPRERWMAVYEHHGPTVHYTEEEVRFFRLRPQTLTFRESGGLLQLKLRYQSPALQALRERVGALETMPAFVDREDLSYVVVIDPYTQTKLKVPCVEDPRYIAGLTGTQQRMILAIARQRGINNPSLAQLWAARRELEIQVAQASTSNKLRRRKWARRQGVPVTAIEETPKVPKKDEHLMTDLEFRLEELKTVKLSDEDRW